MTAAIILSVLYAITGSIIIGSHDKAAQERRRYEAEGWWRQ